MHQSDKLYAKSRQVVEQFQFDAQVASVFNDMVNRSVPGYTLMLDVLGVVAEKYIHEHNLCYDLGCSLGASTLAIRQNIKASNCRIIAIDNASAMIDRCRQVVDKDKSATPVDIIEQNITQTTFQPAKLISMNLTLQFIAPDKKNALLNNIAKSLTTGGVLFLSEKIAFREPFEQRTLNKLHHQFKKHQGYSSLEIAQKRDAIENVLIPDSIDEHKSRLIEAGFSHVIMILQCFNFCSLLAFK